MVTLIKYYYIELQKIPPTIIVHVALAPGVNGIDAPGCLVVSPREMLVNAIVKSTQINQIKFKETNTTQVSRLVTLICQQDTKAKINLH